MIITIRNDEGVETNFDIDLIDDEEVKQEATVIVQKVGNLQVTIEALDFASRTHRANLEQLLGKKLLSNLKELGMRRDSLLQTTLQLLK